MAKAPQGDGDTVPFLDTETGRIVRIPARELNQDAIQVRLEGVEGLVWVMAKDLKSREPQHPPFGQELLAYCRQIHDAFAEHRPLSLDEWEDGFRRDAHPEKEIALWLHAAEVYTAYAGSEPSPVRRKDYYRVIVTCLTASPDSVWHALELQSLGREEAQEMIDRFYGMEA